MERVDRPTPRVWGDEPGDWQALCEENARLRKDLEVASHVIYQHETMARAAMRGDEDCDFERVLAKFIIDGADWCQQHRCRACVAEDELRESKARIEEYRMHLMKAGEVERAASRQAEDLGPRTDSERT